MTTLSAAPTQTPLPSAAAQHYLDLGLTPIPFSIHDKGPFKRGWQSHAYTSPRDFPTPSNIGLLLGPQGNYLADIDLDSAEAIQLAPHYLPTTNWLSGHSSSPQSHYWYIIDTNSPLPEYHKFDDPRPNSTSGSGSRSILELRWGLPDAAHQTVVPPSIHPNREPYVWYPTGNLPDTLPPVVHGGSLTTTVRRLASACLLTRIWKQSHGIRNDLTMALSGALFRAKWDPLNIAQFIQSIAHCAHDEELPKRLETIRATLRRTPSRPTTGWPEVAQLIGKDAASSIFGWLALREPLRRAQNSYAKDLPFTDLGNAQRLIDAYGHDLIHVSEERRWYLYTGAYWKPDATQDVHRRANYLVNKLDEDASLQALDPSHDHSHEDRDGIPLLQKVARRSQSHGKLVAIVARASTLEEVARPPGLFDQDIWALNLENGTLDLRTGELRPHCREDYLTYCLDIHYDPSAECPSWLRFLDQITGGDPELLAYLQRCVGYSLTGSIDEQCLFILHGPGANGKSVFIQSIADLFGPYAARGTTETFLKQRNASGPMNDLAALSGKRFVQIAEAEAGRNLAEALVKDVTGGEKISARFLYQEFFSFTPTFKLWLSTNHRPIISGTDQAIWRRIKLIPFTVVIAPEERVPMADLLKRHADEGAGILNWALEGCALWRRAGLRSPAQVDEAVKAYREEMDVIGTWLAERCIRKEQYKARFGELYEDYRAWCEGLGEPVPSSRSFSEDLRRHEGLVRIRSGGTVLFKGVRLHESV